MKSRSRVEILAVLAGAVALAVGGGSLRASSTAVPEVSLTADPIVTFAVVTGEAPPAPPKTWVDEVKQPTPWFNWGSDLRLRQEYFNNAITLNEQAPGHEWSFGRYRVRAWATVSPCEEFDAYVRMAWEGRHWFDPATRPEWDNGFVFFDNLYGKLKLPQIGTTVTVGRQDLILGDGWLVLEGTPLDGSTSIYMDAVRANVALKDIATTFDLIYIDNSAYADTWLPTMGSTSFREIEQDERGAIAYVTNKSIKNTEISPYFIYKHDDAVAANGDTGEIYTFGARAVEDFTENLRGRVEGAGQFGRRNGQPLSAYGFNARLSYLFKDSMQNELRLNYEYLSGDKPGNGTNEAFDPLWGRWPQWSELYIYTYATETRIAETTNLQRIGPAYLVRPTKEMELEFTYNCLLANENTKRGSAGFADSGNYRGSLFTAILRYKFNRFLSGHLWSEYFIPGNYYTSPMTDNAVYLRAELVVTF